MVPGESSLSVTRGRPKSKPGSHATKRAVTSRPKAAKAAAKKAVYPVDELDSQLADEVFDRWEKSLKSRQ
jgi:hypothetical protein